MYEDVKEKLKKADRADAFVSAAEMIYDLSVKEQQVLAMRIGLMGYSKHTLKEIGEILGLSRERIRQIESKALRKLNQRGFKHV